MAKSKTKAKTKTKQVDDEEDLLVKTEEEEAVEDADEEPVAEDTEPDADDGDAKDDDDGESPPPSPAAPSPKVTKFTIALILLNLLAVPAFLTFVFMDWTVRERLTYRTLLNYTQAYGLPLASEEEQPSAANETRARVRLTSAQLEEAFKKRVPGKGNQNFVPYEETIDKPVGFRLRPSDMRNETLKRDVFQNIPDPVATLDEAIEKLQSALPADIQRAAGEVVAKYKDVKDDAKKRALIAKILLPIAWDVKQVKTLDDKIEATKGADLDKLLDDAAQRRMYYDILAPLNVYKPGELSDFKNYEIEKLSSDAYDLNKIKKFMTDRLAASIAAKYDPELYLGKDHWPADVNRDSIEKRHYIGFVLFSLGQVSVPTLDKKLYPKGVERAQVISGLTEFTNASIYYVRAVRYLEERIVAAIKADRDGYVTLLKDKQSTPGFIADYDREVDALVKLVEYLDSAEKRLDNIKSKRDEIEKNLAVRTEQHAKTLDQLLKARKNTEKLAHDLRRLQDQLHQALVQLSDAGEVNFRLEGQIREIELNYLKKKGGQ